MLLTKYIYVIIIEIMLNISYPYSTKRSQSIPSTGLEIGNAPLSTWLARARQGLHKLVPASEIAGKWAVKHRVGLSYALGAAAAGVTAYNAAKGIGGLDVYGNFNEVAQTWLGMDPEPAGDPSASKHMAIASIAGTTSMISTCAALTMRHFKESDSGDYCTMEELLPFAFENETQSSEFTPAELSTTSISA